MSNIRQEIQNNVYENGEQLITGPILQEVLLDMVTDYEDKIGSGSVPAELVEKTGSWDSASAWVEDNKDNLATKEEIPDISGLATTESLNGLSSSVAEDFANLDIPSIEGLATTESLNQFSESVASDFANLPDFSEFATKDDVNETSASVKQWVLDQRYLTTASLSGSVTEETVGFMINDATASVKEWVENKNYVTSESLDGYATEDWVQEQGYLTEHQDISGLATTESVNQLSESVAQTIDNLDIPDVSGLATTASVTSLSESIATDITSLSESIAAITGSDLSGYVTTASYLQDSASFDERINSISGSDLSGYATTESLNSLSESVAADLESKATQEDILNTLASTGLAESEGEEWTIYEAAKADDLYYVSESLNALSESVADITIPDVSIYATTSSVNSLSESVASDFANLNIPDVSGYATTQSVNDLSASFDLRINNIPVVDPSEYVTTQSFNLVSASFDERIDAIVVPDLSEYATTSSLNSLSESVAQDVADLSASIADITGSGGGDYLPLTGGNLKDPDSVTSETYLVVESPDPSSYEVSGSISLIAADPETVGTRIVIEEDANQSVTLYGNGTIEKKHFNEGAGEPITEIIELPNGTGTLALQEDITSFSESVAYDVEALSTSIADIPVIDPSEFATTQSVSEVSESVYSLSESVASDFANLDIPDVSIYATTASLNSVSESLSASIAAITSSGGGGSSLFWESGSGLHSVKQKISGETNTAAGVNSVVVGRGNAAYNTASFAQGHLTNASGKYSHAEGWINSSAGTASHAEGHGSAASGDISHAEGSSSVAAGVGAHAEGWSSNASGNYSHAEGLNTTSTGESSHAEGHRTVAMGLASHAEGSASRAVGIYSHAEGYMTTASGSYSHAEGYESTAVGVAAHAEGERCLAKSGGSYARGLESTASADYSYAGGFHAQTTNDYEYALGKYNSTASNQIFSVGTGVSNNPRNAISVRTGSNGSASIYIQGVGTYDGTNPLKGTNDLATVIASISGAGDTELRNFLFGTDTTQNITSITSSVTNIYTSPSQNSTLGFSTVPDDGETINIVVHNDTVNGVTITLPVSVTVDSVVYNLINNGADNSGSMSIPAGEYGDIVVTRIGTDLFLRTSLNLADISGSSVTIVTTLDSGSTDSEVPSAKCVYDLVGDIESALIALR